MHVQWLGCVLLQAVVLAVVLPVMTTRRTSYCVVVLVGRRCDMSNQDVFGSFSIAGFGLGLFWFHVSSQGYIYFLFPCSIFGWWETIYVLGRGQGGNKRWTTRLVYRWVGLCCCFCVAIFQTQYTVVVQLLVVIQRLWRSWKKKSHPSWYTLVVWSRKQSAPYQKPFRCVS